jgi:hypothetical protein
VAIDYNIQRNKLYTTLLSTETSKGNPFLDKKYSFTDFYKRFFSTDQGVKDLYNALTTTKKNSGDFFLDPKKYTLANFYFSFGCDLTFAPKEYCEAQNLASAYRIGKETIKDAEKISSKFGDPRK